MRGGVVLNLPMSKSLKRHELKLRGGVILNLMLSKSLKRVELKLRGGVLLKLLLKAEKVRDYDERRNEESSQAATIRLIDNRHSSATRSMMVVDRAISNVLNFG